ncbi:hypothetical protein M9H77_30475 [Catharanthus roseus]|uniref:Uncharacterized protein n=1 Tax=Catharanthus roseus TaxID=4058 RepID=A0ACC0A1M3_CATRO|nr:hypothetical protein M9H77_30475 [Catharanthus roseus]
MNLILGTIVYPILNIELAIAVAVELAGALLTGASIWGRHLWSQLLFSLLGFGSSQEEPSLNWQDIELKGFQSLFPGLEVLMRRRGSGCLSGGSLGLGWTKPGLMLPLGWIGLTHYIRKSPEDWSVLCWYCGVYGRSDVAGCLKESGDLLRRLLLVCIVCSRNSCVQYLVCRH